VAITTADQDKSPTRVRFARDKRINGSPVSP
jgi:hypothetical protein